VLLKLESSRRRKRHRAPRHPPRTVGAYLKLGRRRQFPPFTHSPHEGGKRERKRKRKFRGHLIKLQRREKGRTLPSPPCGHGKGGKADFVYFDSKESISRKKKGGKWRILKGPGGSIHLVGKKRKGVRRENRGLISHIAAA